MVINSKRCVKNLIRFEKYEKITVEEVLGRRLHFARRVVVATSQQINPMDVMDLGGCRVFDGHVACTRSCGIGYKRYCTFYSQWSNFERHTLTSLTRSTFLLGFPSQSWMILSTTGPTGARSARNNNSQ